MNLELLDIPAHFGKISNNVIKATMETDWTIPLSGILLSREQLISLVEDECIWDCWYYQEQGKPIYPRPWWAVSDGIYYIEDDFSAKSVIITTKQGESLTFVDEGDDEEGQPTLRIANLRLAVRPNGYTELLGSLHIRPGRGHENLILQEQQYQQILLSLSGTKVLVKEGKQEDLPFHPMPVGGTKAGERDARLEDPSVQPESESPTVDAGEASAENTIDEDYSLEVDDGESESVNLSSSLHPQTGVDASGTEAPATESEPEQSGAQANNPDSEAASQASEAPPELQQLAKQALEMGDAAFAEVGEDFTKRKPSPEYYEGRTYQNPDGAVTYLRPQSEVDKERAEFQFRRRERAAAKAARDATSPEEFERIMKAELEKHQGLPSNLINGRK